MFKKRNGEIYKPSLADFIPVMSSVIGTKVHYCDGDNPLKRIGIAEVVGAKQ